MAKSNAIELQIAHGSTPMPFLVPMKKAANRQLLEEIVRRRTGCDDLVKITMYNRSMIIVDWDDWEDLIEPNGRYLADIDDSWIVHSHAKGHGTSDNSFKMFLESIVEGKTPTTITDYSAEIGDRAVGPAAPVGVYANTGTSISTTATVLKNVVDTTDDGDYDEYQDEDEDGEDEDGEDGYEDEEGEEAKPISQPSTTPSGSDEPAAKPVGPAGEEHGIVHPDVEKRLMEVLRQQLDTLAFEWPSSGHKSTREPQTPSSGPESSPDDSLRESHGGVKLDCQPPGRQSARNEPRKFRDDSPDPNVGRVGSSPTGPDGSQPVQRCTAARPYYWTKDGRRISKTPSPDPIVCIPKFKRRKPGSSLPSPPEPSSVKTVDEVPDQQLKPDNKDSDAYPKDNLPGGALKGSPERAQGNGSRKFSNFLDNYPELANGNPADFASGNTSDLDLQRPAESKYPNITSDERKQELLSDEHRITFLLVKPKNKNRPTAFEGNVRIFLSTTRECTPARLLTMLGKNPKYTRLLFLIPALDQSHYVSRQIINPGTRTANIPFSDSGWESEVIITWEHIQNEDEEENIKPEHPWDLPDDM
ncbi:hypothetical protein TWF730_002428 [Orbilia blumenaviensis]|uniref:Uncharacterized protein n=1 Tax=Orbilia blumenaviensis TaxID=1796055 RepID=A0AAV9UAR5_9PEZI